MASKDQEQRTIEPGEPKEPKEQNKSEEAEKPKDSRAARDLEHLHLDECQGFDEEPTREDSWSSATVKVSQAISLIQPAAITQAQTDLTRTLVG